MITVIWDARLCCRKVSLRLASRRARLRQQIGLAYLAFTVNLFNKKTNKAFWRTFTRKWHWSRAELTNFCRRSEYILQNAFILITKVFVCKQWRGFEFDSGWQWSVELPFEAIERGKKFYLPTRRYHLRHWDLRYSVLRELLHEYDMLIVTKKYDIINLIFVSFILLPIHLQL